MPSKNEMFIIVRCGYEGIEEICWGGTIRKEAEQKIQEYKQAVVDLKKRLREAVPISEGKDDEHDFDRWDAESEWLHNEREAGRLGILAEVYSIREMEPDRYCVMKYEEGDTRFQCCCSEMKVSLEQPWLMG